MAALGHGAPQFAHHSLLTGPQGESLSKRLGTLSLRDLRAQGVEPMALLSLMARLGSSDPVTLQTDMGQLIDGFEIERFGAAPTKFDAEDLGPLTSHYLQAIPFDDVRSDIASIGVPDDLAEAFWIMARDNISTRSDIASWWALCRDGAEPLVDAKDEAFVREAIALLPNPPFDAETWKTWTTAVRASTGRKGRQLFMPLRKALTGRETGPEMGLLLPLMQVVRARI